MLILRATADLLRVVTGSAGDIRAHVSAMEADNAAPPVVQDIVRVNTASIATAATTTILDCTTSNRRRNVKLVSLHNVHASVTNAIYVDHTDGTTAEKLWEGTLLPSESVMMDESGVWTPYSASGLPKVVGLPVNTKGDLLVFDTAMNRLGVGADGQSLVAAASATPGVKWATTVLNNRSTVTVSAGYAVDTYLAGSSISIPAGGPVVGTIYHCLFDMVKTGAGTGLFTVNVRYGTAGATSDASILSLAFAAGTTAADTGLFDLWLHFRTVGAGTSAVVVATISCSHHLAATGLVATGASGYGQITTVSSGFNSTPANSILGLSVNGGASFSGTNTLVQAEAFNLSI